MLAEYQQSKDERNMDPEARTLSFNKRVLSNARVASQVCNLFIKTIKSQLPNDEDDDQCIHSRNAPKDVAMSAIGQSRFTSAFYQMSRYSAMLQRTSRPRELRLEQLPFKVFFPMLRLSMWSCMLETQSLLEELLNLITPGAYKASGEVNNDHSSHPWVKTCRFVFEAKSRKHLGSVTGAACWFDFFEGCQWNGERESFLDFSLPLFCLVSFWWGAGG